MSKPGSIVALVCAFNEEKLLPGVLRSLRHAKMRGVIGGFVVVSDGSKDRTALLARRAGAEVVELKKNMGKAFAFAAGVRRVTLRFPNCSFLVSLDADLKPFGSREIVRLVSHLKKNPSCLMVVGERENDALFEYGGERAFRMASLRGLVERSSEWVKMLNLLGTARGKARLEEIRSAGFGLELGLNELLAGSAVEWVPTHFRIARAPLSGQSGNLIPTGLSLARKRIEEYQLQKEGLTRKPTLKKKLFLPR